MRRHIFPKYRAVARELQIHGDVGPALHMEGSLLYLHVLPAVLGLVAQRVAGIELFQIKILLVHAENSPAPGDVLVVSVFNAGRARLGGPNYVPARSDQVNNVAERRDLIHRAVRIIAQKWPPGGGELARDYPVVAGPIVSGGHVEQDRKSTRLNS